jgi:ATP-binding cassette, subfamily B, bacterial MsbA
MAKQIWVKSMDNLKRLLNYTKKYWQRLTYSLIFAALFGLTSAAPTYLLKQTIDEVFIKSYSHLIIPFILLFVLFFMLKGIFMYLSSYCMYWVSNKVLNDLRKDLFSRMVHYPISFFQDRTTGQLLSHYLNDIQMIQNVAAMAVKDGVRSVFEGTFLLGFALYQNWKLSAVMVLIGPAIIISSRKLGKARKKASFGIQNEMGKVSNMLTESFTGMREIKAFNAENTECSRFTDLLSRCFRSIMRNVRVEAAAPALIEAIAITGGGFVFYFAAHQVISGEITAGTLTSFFAAILLAYQPLKKLVALYSEVQYGLAAADRIFDTMDLVYPATQNRDFELSPLKNQLQFKDLSFAYNKNLENQDNFVFRNVNLTIKKGECIGIVGPSGAGKSTLCDLLLGFIVPTSGQILLDDQDISKVTYSSLRNCIGYVGQRTFLFNDTIYSNVLYARQTATEREVLNACKAAHVDEFANDLPLGYYTSVGENGSLLSGGQKQRITIARTLLKSPDIIIFDEATSSLDQKSEKIIQQAIYELRGLKTIIIITHRPSMLDGVDRIFNVNNGQVKEIEKDSTFYTQVNQPY